MKTNQRKSVFSKYNEKTQCSFSNPAAAESDDETFPDFTTTLYLDDMLGSEEGQAPNWEAVDNQLATSGSRWSQPQKPRPLSSHPKVQVKHQRPSQSALAVPSEKEKRNVSRSSSQYRHQPQYKLAGAVQTSVLSFPSVLQNGQIAKRYAKPATSHLSIRKLLPLSPQPAPKKVATPNRDPAAIKVKNLNSNQIHPSLPLRKASAQPKKRIIINC